MSVTPQAIKELRERTQAGMSDCKGALVEASGDMEKAVEVIVHLCQVWEERGRG